MGTCDVYDPTPAEIRAICWEIQSEWSERERQRRAGLIVGEEEYEPWTVPVVCDVGVGTN